VTGISFDQCQKQCADNHRYKGLEYSDGFFCELWKKSFPGKFEKKEGFACYWKTQDTYRVHSGDDYALDDDDSNDSDDDDNDNDDWWSGSSRNEWRR